MKIEYLDQKLCVETIICISKAMEKYAFTGAENYGDVLGHLNKALQMVASELTPENKEKAVKWLEKKQEALFNIEKELT